MTTRKTGTTTDRTMSVQEAGRRGGQRVQELVHKGKQMEIGTSTNFGEKLPRHGRSDRGSAKDR